MKMLLGKLKVKIFKRRYSSLISLTQTYFGQDHDEFGKSIEEIVESYCDNGKNATIWLKNEVTEMLQTENDSELQARMELLAENQFSPGPWGETWRSFLQRVLHALPA
ncbi:MAG: contact-dependent growth inhibition system immunity protein [Pantoea sp.]|nr:contact-dependent growth inhibition system immunity protein [Pantoea sp.]